MKISVDRKTAVILAQVAKHLGVDLGEPWYTFAIENKELANVALALGGEIVGNVEVSVGLVPPVEKIDPPTINHAPGVLNDMPPCVICGKPLPSRRAKTHEGECKREYIRRYQNQRAAEKRDGGSGSQAERPLAGRISPAVGAQPAREFEEPAE